MQFPNLVLTEKNLVQLIVLKTTTMATRELIFIINFERRLGLRLYEMNPLFQSVRARQTSSHGLPFLFVVFFHREVCGVIYGDDLFFSV